MRGLELLKDTIIQIKDNDLNPNLEIIGILPTMFSDRILHNSEVINEIQKKYENDIVFEPIKRSIRFSEATVKGESILDYISESEGANTYRSIGKVIDESIKRRK